MLRNCGLLGATRLSNNFAKALEEVKGLTKEVKQFGSKTKEIYTDPSMDNRVVGTVTHAADGRTITRLATYPGNYCYNGPAENAIAAMGVEMKPKTPLQEQIQNRIFRTAQCNTQRTGLSVDTEIVKPNGENTQYFYHRGVAAKGYEQYPQNVLESPFNVSGEIKYQGGDVYTQNYELRNVTLTNCDTGATKKIGKYRYTEYADD